MTLSASPRHSQNAMAEKAMSTRYAPTTHEERAQTVRQTPAGVAVEAYASLFECNCDQG